MRKKTHPHPRLRCADSGESDGKKEEKFQNALVKIQFIFDKSLMPVLTFGERAIFTLVTCLSKENGKYSDHLSEPRLLMKTNPQCPLENFRML